MTVMRKMIVMWAVWHKNQFMKDHVFGMVRLFGFKEQAADAFAELIDDYGAKVVRVSVTVEPVAKGKGRKQAKRRRPSPGVEEVVVDPIEMYDGCRGEEA